MHMTSLFVQLFENLNLTSFYEGLTPHQVWFNLAHGKQSYREGGGRFCPPSQVENVLNHPGEIRLRLVPIQL